MTACPSPTPKLEFSHRRMRAPEEKSEKWRRERERDKMTRDYEINRDNTRNRDFKIN